MNNFSKGLGLILLIVVGSGLASPATRQYVFRHDGSIFLGAGKALGLEGVTGDTDLQYDADLEQVYFNINGTKSGQLEDGNWRPPVCPTDLNTVPLGGICTQVATGKIRYRGTLEVIP